MSGTIIYLNGTSSSGKTTLVHALHDRLAVPYLHCGIDHFDQMLPYRQLQRGVALDLTLLQQGFTACIVGLASAGNNLIVDDVICEPPSYPNAQRSITTQDILRQRVIGLQQFNLLYVKVFCPLASAEQRERARGDRTIGLACFQYDRVHQGSQYDVTLDTSRQTAAECAEAICSALADSTRPRAFHTMAQRFCAKPSLT
jgi:chloramphenicol 3-O phosphotransferase